MTRARSIAVGLLLALFAPLASGCELVADFDRGKIPKPAVDGGGGGGIGAPDGSLVSGGADSPDSGGSVPDASPPPAPDAGSPGVDTGTTDAGDSGVAIPATPSDAG
jgi:hypothetical protein